MTPGNLRIFPRLLLLSSVIPHWGRPVGPDCAGVTSRQEAWLRIYRQARDKVDISNWKHMAHFDELRDIFAELFKGMSE